MSYRAPAAGSALLIQDLTGVCSACGAAPPEQYESHFYAVDPGDGDLLGMCSKCAELVDNELVSRVEDSLGIKVKRR